MGDRDSQYDAWANFINNVYLKGTTQVTNPVINQAVVSSNIRALQSRTDSRGKWLASLEAERSKVKAVIKGLRELGYPVFSQLYEQFHTVAAVIAGVAKDQTLDRQLLKQQYVLQAQSRPPKLPKLPKIPVYGWRAVGSVVRVNRSDYGTDPLYTKGILGKVVKDYGSTLLLDFNNLGNKEGSYKADRGAPTDNRSGAWWVCDFEIDRFNPEQSCEF